MALTTRISLFLGLELYDQGWAWLCRRPLSWMAIAYGCALSVFPCDLLLCIHIPGTPLWSTFLFLRHHGDGGAGLEPTLGALAEPQLNHTFKVTLPIQSQASHLGSEISHRDEERVQFCPQLHWGKCTLLFIPVTYSVNNRNQSSPHSYWFHDSSKYSSVSNFMGWFYWR